MFFPVYERNHGPITEALGPVLADVQGNALEIGSGTGQHVQDFARTFPQLRWTPSDPDPGHRRSTNAWTAHNGLPVAPARALDASSDWARDLEDIAPLAFILSLNVIHIAPFSVAQGIVAGAARTLLPGGLLAFYGPFREGGLHTGDGNAEFDKRLRAQNPHWGVRDVGEISDLAEPVGLSFSKLIKMPANNRILIFSAST